MHSDVGMHNILLVSEDETILKVTIPNDMHIHIAFDYFFSNVAIPTVSTDYDLNEIALLTYLGENTITQPVPELPLQIVTVEENNTKKITREAKIKRMFHRTKAFKIRKLVKRKKVKLPAFKFRKVRFKKAKIICEFVDKYIPYEDKAA
jgi:hypothetical protein